MCVHNAGQAKSKNKQSILLGTSAIKGKTGGKGLYISIFTANLTDALQNAYGNLTLLFPLKAHS